jgi:hypothetical protein
MTSAATPKYLSPVAAAARDRRRWWRRIAQHVPQRVGDTASRPRAMIQPTPISDDGTSSGRQQSARQTFRAAPDRNEQRDGPTAISATVAPSRET